MTIDELIEKWKIILCRQCDGISHADTCELNKAECPVLNTCPNQLLGTVVKEAEVCPECQGRMWIPTLEQNGNTVCAGTVSCLFCHGTGRTEPKTILDLIKEIKTCPRTVLKE